MPTFVDESSVNKILRIEMNKIWYVTSDNYLNVTK